MRFSDAIIKFLEKSGVEYIFGISAGTVSSLYDSIIDTDIKPIITKHEAGAVYSATKYAEITNELGVCVVAGGVGLNNTINGIGDAMRSKAPLLMISGYVHRWQIGKGAVQEVNTEKIVEPIAKYSKTVLKEDKVISELKKAIKIALTPPYGPVHISIPIDLQISEYTGKIPEPIGDLDIKDEYDFNSIGEAIQLIDQEEQGIIMVGRGCQGFAQQVKELSKHLNWPIITTPEGKGVISSEYDLNLGNYGHSSTDAALDYIEDGEATCILVLGSSLGESATRNYNDILVKDRKVVHVDWDKQELSKVFKPDVGVHCDLGVVLPEFIEKISRKDNDFQPPELINAPYESSENELLLKDFVKEVVEVLPNDTYFISDIGEYINYLFKYLPLKKDMNFNISLNYGAMGIGVGGSLGVHLATPEQQTAVIVGDGGFYMNGMEVFTAKEYNMPIIYFIVNNSMMKYVEHGHDYLYGRTIPEFVQQRISFAEMLKTAGIESMQIDSISDVEKIEDFVSGLNGPCVIELNTGGTESVPMSDRFEALDDE